MPVVQIKFTIVVQGRCQGIKRNKPTENVRFDYVDLEYFTKWVCSLETFGYFRVGCGASTEMSARFWRFYNSDPLE